MQSSPASRPIAYRVAVVGWTLVASFLLVIPTYFLAVGLQALGGSLGLWAGDPNSNDGEEGWATVVGLLSSLVVLGCLLGLLLAVRRMYGVASVAPAVVGTLALIAGYVGLWVILFQPLH